MLEALKQAYPVLFTHPSTLIKCRVVHTFEYYIDQLDAGPFDAGMQFLLDCINTDPENSALAKLAASALQDYGSHADVEETAFPIIVKSVERLMEVVAKFPAMEYCDAFLAAVNTFHKPLSSIIPKIAGFVATRLSVSRQFVLALERICESEAHFKGKVALIVSALAPAFSALDVAGDAKAFSTLCKNLARLVEKSGDQEKEATSPVLAKIVADCLDSDQTHMIHGGFVKLLIQFVGQGGIINNGELIAKLTEATHIVFSEAAIGDGQIIKVLIYAQVLIKCQKTRLPDEWVVAGLLQPTFAALESGSMNKFLELAHDNTILCCLACRPEAVLDFVGKAGKEDELLKILSNMAVQEENAFDKPIVVESLLVVMLQLTLSPKLNDSCARLMELLLLAMDALKYPTEQSVQQLVEDNE